MTPSRSLRPALAVLCGILVASCSAVEDETFSFEALANEVASIPVDMTADPSQALASPASAHDLGLRPAFQRDAERPGSLVVEVLDPHALWDARDGLRRSAASTRQQTLLPQGVALSEVPQAELRPAISDTLRPSRSATAPVPTSPTGSPSSRASLATIQLGAFSSEAAARTAWSRVSTGPAAEALEGLEPDFVKVQINGRSMVRLRISAPSARASVICRAADITDPWCLKAT